MADQYDHDLEEAIRLSLLELEKASPKPTVLTASIPAAPPRPPPPVHAEDAIDPEILLAIELSLAEAAEQRPQTFEKAENVPVEKTRTPGSETVSIPPEKLRKIKKLKYYYQGNLGVDLLLEENNSLKIQARDQLSANIAKVHLEERISNWSLVEKESATLKSQHIHIYIDQSHLFHGCQFVSNGSAQGTVRRDATVGVSCSKLHKFLKKGRNVQEKHVFGSIHPKIGGFVHPKWKAMDYHPILTDQSYQATSSSSRFAAKDSNAIVSQLQKTIMFSKAIPPSHSRTLLIVVGGREQEGSPWDLQLDALLEVVHQAIFNRWCVELWMWKDTAERAILDMRDFYPPDVFSILFLDNHRDHIVTRVKRRPVIPPPPLPPPPPPRPVSTTTAPSATTAPSGPVRRSSSKTSKLLDIARWFSSSSKDTGFVALDDEDTVVPVTSAAGPCTQFRKLFRGGRGGTRGA